MIVTRKACQCALCSHEWLPTRSKQNPTADPRKVKRCASCKSFAWNADDPKVIAARQAKAKVPEVQAEVFDYHQRMLKVAQDICGAAPAVFASRSICKHRVLLAHCTLCNPHTRSVSASDRQ